MIYTSIDSPLISVVVPAYNCQSYIGPTLLSIIGQTYRNIEVIVIDDGSTDGSSEVIRQFTMADNRVKYIYKKNGGQASARNIGIKESKGEYIAFCDSDDIWCEQKLQSQLCCLENTRFSVCYTDVEHFDDVTGNIINHIPKKDGKFRRGHVLNPLLAYNFVTHSTLFVRRSCFDTAGNFDETIKMGDDWDMLLRLATFFEFDYLEAKLVRYRVARAGQVSSNKVMRFEYWEKILSKYRLMYPEFASEKVLNTAKASMLINKAWCLRNDDDYGAVECYLKIILLQPGNLQAYLSLLKTALAAIIVKPFQEITGRFQK